MTQTSATRKPAPANDAAVNDTAAAVTDYYGCKQGTTYLEVYSRLDGTAQRVVHRQLRDQDAYDTWHLAFYMKEILSYQQLMRGGDASFDAIPRKEKNLLLYLMLSARPQFATVLELGSSLFELIDGLEAVGRYFTAGDGARCDAETHVDTRALSFVGVEISDMLATASQLLHSGHTIEILPDCTQATGRYDLLYDRNVTSYAFTSPRELAAFINRSEAALLNLFVSKGQTFISARLGKSLTYFSLRELVEQLNKPLVHLFGLRAPGPHDGPALSMGRPVVEGFFMCADQAFVDDWLAVARRDPAVWAWFEQKDVRPKAALSLLDEGAD